MQKTLLLALILAFACGPAEQPAAGTSAEGLRKVAITNPADVEKLRDSGAEIIVLETDYAIIRAGNSTAAASFTLLPFSEEEMVQRLVKVQLTDSLGLQPVVDAGLDFWKVENGKAVARAFDIHIENLRTMGYEVEIVARDASQRGGKK